MIIGRFPKTRSHNLKEEIYGLSKGKIFKIGKRK